LPPTASSVPWLQGGSRLPIPAKQDRGELELAAAIAAVARDLSRSVPAPRGAPFFYLDAGVTYDLGALDGMARRGIFRKYEMVLEIGCGLGGKARWLATQFGCRVVGVDARIDSVAGAILLNRKAYMQDRVLFQVGEPIRLPFRDRLFTHVWILDERVSLCAETLHEARRVLRDGGHFAVHIAGALPDRLAETIRSVGFADTTVRPVILTEVAHSARLARARLRADPVIVPGTTPQSGAQVFARRPA
jgi:SAM-dependent methyltransferase